MWMIVVVCARACKVVSDGLKNLGTLVKIIVVGTNKNCANMSKWCCVFVVCLNAWPFKVDYRKYQMNLENLGKL